MAKKADRFYYDNFIQAADVCCQAAKYLSSCVANYVPENTPKMLVEMHEIEHKGDVKRHEMSAALAKAFVTPVDREDMEVISQNIDEVTDSLEEVIQRFYVDNITTIPPEAVEFTGKLVECCELLKAVMGEFSNFKKPAKLRELIIELNNKEEDCDSLYLEATKKVTEHFSDVLQILYWREIYDKMEYCADACEHVADSIEMVVMKNT